MKALRQTVTGVPPLKLADVAELNPRLTEKLSADAEVAFVPMAALSAETASVTAEETRAYADVSKGYTSFASGDVLLAKITPCFENGKIAQANLTKRIGFGSTEFHVIRPSPDKLDARYTHHFLRLDRIRVAGERRMTASGGQRRVPEAYLAELPIPLPPLAEQRRIAEVLDRAEALRAKRRAALAQLDSLTQSLFVDAFGDPLKNPKHIKTAKLGSLCVRVTDGTHQPPKWSEEGHPFLFVSNIVSGEITFETEKFISDETHADLTRRCPIELGDVLYSTVGSYGVPAIVRSKRKFAFQRHIAHLKPERTLLDSEFLAAMLASPPLKRQADRAAKGVAQKTVNLSEIREFIVFQPPLQLQREFARRVTAVEKLKAAQRASLAELDALFATLQHRAFRGEL